jgi:hypothetical protein
MQIVPEAIADLKANLGLRLEGWLKIFEYERQWPRSGNQLEKNAKIQAIIQAEREIIRELESLNKHSPLPENLEECLAFFPAAERPSLEEDFKRLRELAGLILKEHKKNVENLKLRSEELTQALQEIRQQRTFVQAWRQTRSQAGRVNLTG